MTTPQAYGYQAQVFQDSGQTASVSIDINDTIPIGGLAKVTWWIGFSVTDPAGAVDVKATCTDDEGATSDTYANPTDLVVGTSSNAGAAQVWIMKHAEGQPWTFDMTVLAGSPTFDYQVVVEIYQEWTRTP